MAIGLLTRRAKAAHRVEAILDLDEWMRLQEQRLKVQLRPGPDYETPLREECEVEVRK